MRKLIKYALLRGHRRWDLRRDRSYQRDGDIGAATKEAARYAGGGAVAGGTLGLGLAFRARRKSRKLLRLAARSGGLAGVGKVVSKGVEVALEAAQVAALAARPRVEQAIEAARPKVEQAIEAARPSVEHAAEAVAGAGHKAAGAARPRVEHATELAMSAAGRAVDRLAAASDHNGVAAKNGRVVVSLK